MTTAAQDITHYAGDDATITIVVLDGNGTKVDLSGATARWWMGKSKAATGADVYIKKSTGGSGITIDQTTDSDNVVITLAGSDTSSLTKFGALYHECEVVASDGTVSTVCVGKFTLIQTMIPNA